MGIKDGGGGDGIVPKCWEMRRKGAHETRRLPLLVEQRDGEEQEMKPQWVGLCCGSLEVRT